MSTELYAIISFYQPSCCSCLGSGRLGRSGADGRRWSGWSCFTTRPVCVPWLRRSGASSSSWTLTALRCHLDGRNSVRDRTIRGLLKGFRRGWQICRDGGLRAYHYRRARVFAPYRGPSAATLSTVARCRSPELLRAQLAERMIIGTLAVPATLV